MGATCLIYLEHVAPATALSTCRRPLPTSEVTAATFERLNSGDLHGFVDESSVLRSPTFQEYLVCAVLLAEESLDEARDTLRPLLRPGQLKFHWSAEGPPGRAHMVEALSALEPTSIVVIHGSPPQHKTERFRRKCLEVLYYELISMGVENLTLEGRTPAQDKRDVAHIVALRNQGLPRSLGIGHCRGGHEPLLWIADAVLGAVNSAQRGVPQYLYALAETTLLRRFTPDSLAASERP